mgnify:CR=1 FL=1
MYAAALILGVALLCYPLTSLATTYPLSQPNTGVVGSVATIQSKTSDSIEDLANTYDLGVMQLIAANQGLSNKVLQTTTEHPVIIPTQFVLPEPRDGVVINLPEMRLYFFQNQQLQTYPVGIGKVGHIIPITTSKISKKVVNPIWIPTANIRAYNLAKHVVLPEMMLPGPNNPLGGYALYLDMPTYRIHESKHLNSIGNRASFGCIRMRPQDIADFFAAVPTNTKVYIINEPSKLAWLDNKLYLSVHPPLVEKPTATSTYQGIVKMIMQFIATKPAIVNWELVQRIARSKDGIPHAIGFAVLNPQNL